MADTVTSDELATSPIKERQNSLENGATRQKSALWDTGSC